MYGAKTGSSLSLVKRYSCAVMQPTTTQPAQVCMVFETMGPNVLALIKRPRTNPDGRTPISTPIEWSLRA